MEEAVALVGLWSKNDKLVPAGRSFFDSSGSIENNCKKEAYKGLYQIKKYYPYPQNAKSSSIKQKLKV